MTLRGNWRGVFSWKGAIRSIQQFEITIPANGTSNTATINSVDTTRSAIFFAGFTTTNTTTAQREIFPRVALTNANTVTATRDTASATDTVTVRGTVVEFLSSFVSSVQHGTVSVSAGSASGTETITSVNTSRSCVLYLGFTCTTAGTSPGAVVSRLDLTDATTVTATRATTSTPVLTVGFCVIEFAPGVTTSIQQRSVALSSTSTSSTDTITSVDTARTILLYNGVSCNTTTLSTFNYNVALTNSTTATLTRTGAASTSRTINYTAVEFASGVVNSLQRGTTAVASATSADTTITSVETSKAFCNWLHMSQTGSTADLAYATTKLLNATTVRSEKNTAGASTSTTSWEVVQFF